MALSTAQALPPRPPEPQCVMMALDLSAGRKPPASSFARYSPSVVGRSDCFLPSTLKGMLTEPASGGPPLPPATSPGSRASTTIGPTSALSTSVPATATPSTCVSAAAGAGGALAAFGFDQNQPRIEEPDPFCPPLAFAAGLEGPPCVHSFGSSTPPASSSTRPAGTGTGLTQASTTLCWGLSVDAASFEPFCFTSVALDAAQPMASGSDLLWSALLATRAAGHGSA
mmetsp:Transcript_14019/g.40426  ORF Transcript_14019/g.40426 Transcript_14019/m.40426 type:complete len:227 (+) Transcript_14019:369-1049(+)